MATGITERGSICQFNMSFNVWFEPGAGIVPTHGGFLMCGKNSNSQSTGVGLFMVYLIYQSYQLRIFFQLFYVIRIILSFNFLLTKLF